MDDSYHIQLLGSLRVRQSNQRFTRFHADKPGALLGYLAYHRHQAHPREALIAHLWPEAEESLGRDSLSAALWAIRKRLSTLGISAEAVLPADRFTVQINPALVSTDVEEFDAHLHAAANAGELRERAHWLEQALGVYQGKLLPGFYEEWIEPEQQRLEDHAYEAARRLTVCLVELGELDLALEYARRAVGMEPLCEEAHQEIMQICVALRRPGAALRQYHLLERLLRREHLPPPSAGIRRCMQQIRSQPASKPSETERWPSSKLPDPLLAVPIGTLTFLLMERPAALRAVGEPQSNCALMGPQEWQAVMEREIAFCHGCLVHSLENEIIAVFTRAEHAFVCADDCQDLWICAAAIAGAEQPPSRMALMTRAIRDPVELYQSALLRYVVGLLSATPSGCMLCSEATAALLRVDTPFGSLFQEVGVYRLPGFPESERLFGFSWAGRVPALEMEAGSVEDGVSAKPLL